MQLITHSSAKKAIRASVWGQNLQLVLEYNFPWRKVEAYHLSLIWYLQPIPRWRRGIQVWIFKKKGELISAKGSVTKVREIENKLEAERRLREEKIKKIVKKSKTNTGRSNGDTDTPKFTIKSQASAKPNGKPLRVSSVKKLTKKGNVDDDSWTEHRNLKHDGKSSSNGFNKNDYSSGSIRKKML